MHTGTFEMAYGILMPVQQYVIRWVCGHSKTVKLPCVTELPEVADLPHDCPDCYTGPYGNVWD